MKNDNCSKIFITVGTEIGWLNNNKGTIDEYMWSLHRSVVDLHVGCADQQKLEQQVSAHPGFGWGEFSGLSFSGLRDYVSPLCSHDKLGTLGTLLGWM